MRLNMILGRCCGCGFGFSEQLCKDVKVEQTSRDATFDNIIVKTLIERRKKTVLLTKPVFSVFYPPTRIYFIFK